MPATDSSPAPGPDASSAVGVRERAAGQVDLLAKRTCDLLLSGTGLLLSSPLWVIVAVAIKLEDGGPVFFAQRRWGRFGRAFEVRKFRTMVPNADGPSGTVQARVGDPRITKVGAVLRATGLDELPQLLHIWTGDMSLVGPRPLAVDETVTDERGRTVRYEDIPGFQERLTVRPGLTSLATVYSPKDIHPQAKFRQDLIYVRNRSAWLDLKLIALSLWISIRGRWETRDDKF